MFDVDKLKSIVGEDWVVSDRQQMERYLIDETYTGLIMAPADNVVVVKPANAQEISRVMKLANEDGFLVYPRGGGTGVCAGSIPTRDGVVLSLERMDKVVEVDKENLMAVVEAGVTLAQLLEAVEGQDLSFPPHPGDEGAQVGGLVACNAGGTRAVKYGVVRNYVKGLEVVLPTGEVVTMGGKLLKNNTGLDLMHLMIDSEGILGIITKVVLRLYPKFAGPATLVVSFDDRHAAIRSVPKILQNGVIPMAIEYVDRDFMEATAQYLGTTWPCTKGVAHLIVIVTGTSDDDVYEQCEKISEICEKNGSVDTLMAESREEQAHILHIRSECSMTYKAEIAEILDVTVPPAAIGDLMDEIDRLAAEYKTNIPMVAHAGDGNFHPTLMLELKERGVVAEVKHKIYARAIELGGVISGEHGIGKTRLGSIEMCIDETQLDLMRGLKTLFDPNSVLSPDSAIR
ncbi:MAG: FAD-binding protein [Dehalococcoidia bacterium]|nr:FAD-binding protein [Dehalococcoidia bacterium]